MSDDDELQNAGRLNLDRYDYIESVQPGYYLILGPHGQAGSARSEEYARIFVDALNAPQWPVHIADSEGDRLVIRRPDHEGVADVSINGEWPRVSLDRAARAKLRTALDAADEVSDVDSEQQAVADQLDRRYQREGW